MRALLASDDPRAGQAIDLFVCRMCRELGALAAALGGLDGLVFTAGIGERSAEIRKRVCEKVAWLGIELDHAANARGGPRISAEEPGRGLRDPDGRGADDRSAHARRAAPGATAWSCLMPSTETVRPLPFDANLRRLEGKKGLVVGIANENSIAYGCAGAFRSFGAELAITYLNDKAKPYVEPLAAALEASIFLPLDVQVEGQLEAVSGRSSGAGAGSISRSIPSRLPRGRTCMAAWSIARARASCSPWTCPAIPSSAWPGSPSR